MTYLRGDARTEAGQQLRARYEAGDTIRSLMEVTGRSYGYIHGLLRSAGTTMRPRGFQNTARR